MTMSITICGHRNRLAKQTLLFEHVSIDLLKCNPRVPTFVYVRNVQYPTLK